MPGKMNSQTKNEDISKIAKLLEISEETIKNSLEASYVKEDTYVPLKTIRKTEQAIKNELLEIDGIKIIEKDERIYPLGEVASHLLGYTRGISEEELKEKRAEGYNEHSIIGKTGVEKAYENRLMAKNGAEIYIIDKNIDDTSDVYSLYEFEKINDMKNPALGYLNGRFGGIPIKQNF